MAAAEEDTSSASDANEITSALAQVKIQDKYEILLLTATFHETGVQQHTITHSVDVG